MAVDSVPRFGSLTGTAVSLKVIDIGANPIDGVPPYSGMLRRGEATVVGFEPNPEALAALSKAKGPHETYLPCAVGDGQRHTLHFCVAPGMTSIFPPNPRVMNLFHGFPSWGTVVKTMETETRRLDDIEQAAGAQFLKIDCEGAELMILRNAELRLRELLVIQTEVFLLPLYCGQPLFSEVELLLRERGFMLHRFTAVNTRVVQPMLVNNDIRAGLGQLLAADAVFVRDLTSVERLTAKQLLQMAKILHDCYASIDLAYHLLIEHDRRCGGRMADRYLSGLQKCRAPGEPSSLRGPELRRLV